MAVINKDAIEERLAIPLINNVDAAVGGGLDAIEDSHSSLPMEEICSGEWSIGEGDKRGAKGLHSCGSDFIRAT